MMLESMPLWLVIILLFAAMAACYESGMILHHRLAHRADGKGGGSSDEGYSMAGISGLLALLLAFAFGLALNRYEERRNLVTAEANAIGTFATRLKLLSPDDRAPLEGELAAYAAARLEVGRRESVEARSPGIAKVDAAHQRLSADLFAVLTRLPADARTTLLTQAFNSLGDIAAERRAAYEARMPGLVMVLLAVYCLAVSLMLGYAVKGAGGRHRTMAALFFLLLGFAYATVLDLDRPRGGMILVPQREMARIVASLSGQGDAN